MFFVALLVVTFVIALLVSYVVVRMFRGPIDSILERILADDISRAWSKYLRFAVYVTGISSGVNLWKIEQYVTGPGTGDAPVPVELTPSRWTLEVYRTIIETLQGIAWMLLVFFVFALVAFVIVRVFEMRRREPRSGSGDA